MSTQKLTFITSFTVSLPLLCFAITEKMEVVESRENRWCHVAFAAHEPMSELSLPLRDEPGSEFRQKSQSWPAPGILSSAVMINITAN